MRGPILNGPYVKWLFYPSRYRNDISFFGYQIPNILDKKTKKGSISTSAMIVLIQQLPQLHSTSAKREGFGYSSLRSIPHQWNFKFNSKASWKCFCNKNETIHEASQVNPIISLCFYFWGSLIVMKFLLKCFVFNSMRCLCVRVCVCVFISKSDCDFLIWFRVFLLCHRMPLGIMLLLGVQWLFTFSACIFLWALEACLSFPN